MSLGMILLVVLTLLILFGVLQRVLDRMALTDRQALFLVALIFVGGWLPDLRLGMVSLNIGGALVPFGVCVYLFFHAGTGKERIRCLIASVLAAAVIYVVSLFFPADPVIMPFDPMILYGLCGGIIAWLMGRSRRSAFIAGVLGVILADAGNGRSQLVARHQPDVVSGRRGARWTRSCFQASRGHALRTGRRNRRTHRARQDKRQRPARRSARMKEKLSRFALSLMLALALYAAFLPTASADDLTESLHVAVDGTGAYLFSISGEISEGDEYISADNILYRIATVQNGNAIAEKIGEEAMPDVSWLEVGEAQPVFASEIAVPAANTKSDDSRKLIAMYVTHSDESYVPSDGTQSVNGQGGIYDVARDFRDALQQQGIDVILDESTHLPHDSGAYRRSRQTAERLLQKGPDAIIDIHRDGIPDQNEYACSIDGENASRVRLLVGRANQNSTVNREFAKQIKAVADKQYPGLVKDIFIGKGTYNQDLAPHAILLEFGTHTISKERVLNSTEMMAKVVSNTLYGPQTGSAISEKSAKGTSDIQKSAAKDDKGVSGGVIFLIVAVVAGVLIFALAQTGGGKAMGEKIGRNISEMTGGLFGRKPKDGNG